MLELAVVSKTWNDGLVGWVVKLSNDKEAYLQYEYDNSIYSNYEDDARRFYPELSNTVDANRDLTDEEAEAVLDFAKADKEIMEYRYKLTLKEGVIELV